MGVALCDPRTEEFLEFFGAKLAVVLALNVLQARFRA